MKIAASLQLPYCRGIDIYCFSVHQILKTLKILPIGNKTILRDSRILSVVGKWSSEVIPSVEHSTEVSTTSATDVAAIAESADVSEDVEGSGTEVKEVNDGSEIAENVENGQTEAVSQDDVEVPRPVVSNDRSRGFIHFTVDFSLVFHSMTDSSWAQF